MNKPSDLAKYANDLKSTDRMPALFLGHGSPMNAIEENQFVQGFRNIAKRIQTPEAILCISAHWYTKGTKVTAMEMPRTIHDFSGFPEALYQVKYPAKGSPELASEVNGLLTEVPVELDHEWGLDHGTWSVIKHMYPKADIPVIQMSIDHRLSPKQHYDMAVQLNVLRRKGILIVGSGNIVHNLRMVDFNGLNKDNYGFDWAKEAQEKVNSYLIEGNYSPLIHYKNEGKALQLAIPTPDHFLPLIYTLGVQEKHEVIELFNDKMVAGSISMTSIIIG